MLGLVMRSHDHLLLDCQGTVIFGVYRFAPPQAWDMEIQAREGGFLAPPQVVCEGEGAAAVLLTGLW